MMNIDERAWCLEDIGLPQSARILITGGAGFLGSNLVVSLLKDGARVRILDDFSTGILHRLPESSQLEIIKGSILDSEILSTSIIGVDLIIHLASVVGMRRVQIDQDYAFSLSDFGTKLLIEASEDIPIILMSSSSVYGLTSNEMISESGLANWQSCLDYDGGLPGYACGKLMLEEHGREAIARGRSVMIIRPFNVVGPGQLSEYGMVIPSFIQMANTGKELIIYDDGMQTRSFSHINTFTKCLLRLMCSPSAWAKDTNPIDVGAPQETQIRDLARYIIDATCSVSSIQYVPFQIAYPGKFDVRRRIPSTDRLTSLIGHVDWPNIHIIIQDCLNAYQS